jgi:hypothetical protein
MGMSFDRNELISEVMNILTRTQTPGFGPFEPIEFVVGLEEKYGTGVVQQAISLLEKKRKRGRSQPMGGEPDPLWDRELDG